MKFLQVVKDQLSAGVRENIFDIWEEAKFMVQAVSVFHSEKYAKCRQRRENILEDMLMEINGEYVQGELESEG